MAFTLNWAPTAAAQYSQIKEAAKAALKNRQQKKGTKPGKEEGLYKQVAKALQFLAQDPSHPSLNTHEFSSLKNPINEDQKVFEAYAQNNTPGAYRIFWCYGPKRGEITIIAITPHP